MKKAVISSIFILALGMAGFSQRPQTAKVGGGSSQSASAAAAAGRNSGEINLAQGTRIDAELQKTLDVKNARPGDQVLLKTTRDIKQNGRTVIAKGSTLMGRVTDVAQRSKQNNQSRLGMLFDRVQGHGVDMPITASIVSITNVASHAGVADMGDADVFGSSSTSGGASSGRSASSGGLLGGASGGGLLGGVGSTVGGVTNTVGGTAGGVLNTTQQTASGVTRSAGGLQILNAGSTNTSAGNGSILASSNQNIRLEKGSTLGLELNSSASGSVSKSH